MARIVTAAEMMARVRYATDTENDTHITDAEIYKWLTAAIAKTWDKILQNGMGGEGAIIRYFNATAGTIEYPIATFVNGATTAGTGSTGLADFYKVKNLYVSDGNGVYRPVLRLNPSENYAIRGPSSSVSMKLVYLPCAPVFTTGAESFDGINGWEEHAVQLAAVEVKKKKQDDTGQYKSSAREIEENMKTYANRNADTPPRVVRRKAARDWANRIGPFAGGVSAWDLRAGKIELYSPTFG